MEGFPEEATFKIIPKAKKNSRPLAKKESRRETDRARDRETQRSLEQWREVALLLKRRE